MLANEKTESANADHFQRLLRLLELESEAEKQAVMREGAAAVAG